MLKHLAERIQRGCEYLDLKDKLPSHFVISGGVASNIALREGLTGLLAIPNVVRSLFL